LYVCKNILSMHLNVYSICHKPAFHRSFHFSGISVFSHNIKHCLYVFLSGPLVTCLPLNPKLRAIKIHSTTCFRREVKPRVLCHRLTACTYKEPCPSVVWIENKLVNQPHSIDPVVTVWIRSMYSTFYDLRTYITTEISYISPVHMLTSHVRSLHMIFRLILHFPCTYLVFT
jgi:hypothetical protein